MLSLASLALLGSAAAVPQFNIFPPTQSQQQPNLYTASAPADVHAAQATAKTSSPTSQIPGALFDRFVVIWLENTDYTKAVGDPNLAALAKDGILLSNYFGVTHPSEPNYIATVGGDNFGAQNDNFLQVPGNVSSVVDLLEARGISWSYYQEDMPYSGYEGFSYVNQKTQANDYVRKHNPGIIYDANTTPQRLSQIKNLTQFQTDLANDKLPQWMFVTPNMTSDGHDSSVTVAGAWTSNFLAPLMKNPNFMKRTMVLITFDENHTYSQANRVMGILLGDAIPESAKGNDANFYDHYSSISTVEANWGLNHLGRWDAGANVFKVVADRTGDQIRSWDGPTADTPTYFLNASYAGPLNTANSSTGYPTPNLSIIRNGRTILPSIASTYAQEYISKGGKSIYQDSVVIPDGMHPPAGY